MNKNMKSIMKGLLLSFSIAFVLFGFFACADPVSNISPESNDPTPKSDDTRYPVTIVIEGAEEGETVTSDVTEALATDLVTVSVENLGVGRQVILSAAGRSFGQATVRKDGFETFLMQNGPLEITATFSTMPTYAITLNNGGDYLWRERVETVSGEYVAYPGDTVSLISYINNVNDIKRQVNLESPTYGVSFGTDVMVNYGQITSFIMPERDVVINATFNIRTYAFVVNVTGNIAGEGLIFSPENPVEGDTVTVTADGLSNIRQVTIDSPDVTFSETVLTADGTSATFTMPEGDVTVNATFDARYYPLTLAENGADSGESITATVGGIEVTQAKGGDIVTITGALNENRQVELTGIGSGGVFFSEEVLYDGESFSFTMPENAVNISGLFTSIPHTITFSLSSYTVRYAEETIVLQQTEAKSGEEVTFTVWVDPTHEMELSTSDGTPLSLDIVRGEGDAQNWVPFDVTFTMPPTGIEIIGRIEPRSHRISPLQFNWSTASNLIRGYGIPEKEWARPGENITTTIYWTYIPEGLQGKHRYFYIYLKSDVNLTGDLTAYIEEYRINAPNGTLTTLSFSMPNQDVNLRFETLYSD